MAVRSRAPVLCLLLVSFFILLCLRSHPLGLKEIAFWMGRFILILALITFIVSVVTPYFNTVHLSGSSQGVPQEENERHQDMVRKEQQECLRKKASEYSDNVLKPRQEEKFKKLEERFYKMTGQTWKLTEGYALGEEENPQNDSTGPKNRVETPNEEAVRKRRLPEQVTKPPPQKEQPKPKRVITLPEEPSESEGGTYHEDVFESVSQIRLHIHKGMISPRKSSHLLIYVVTIALRCPSGRVYRRRFYKTYSSLVLQDWMTKIGYHPVFYSICMPMPRCPLELKENVTLENIGITRHTALNIEEKDPL
ncbi:UBX domain-containing protein 8 isoform 1-T1 [Anomaloglossus baeobatrachus]|uniref:UBX domain-containing protein 8 isoform X1 n=1 Tax=Anomaloglossus baeobatrachus TaxID=238106 RepID=UPI003F4F4F40